MANTKFVAIEPELDGEALKPGSNRSFGIVFAAAFTVIGLWPLLSGGSPRIWVLIVAFGFVLAAAFAPRSLQPLNVLWLRLGALMHRILTPIIMGVVFLLAVVPTATILRVRGKDPLRLKRDKHAASYWIERNPPGPDPQTMTRQF